MKKEGDEFQKSFFQNLKKPEKKAQMALHIIKHAFMNFMLLCIGTHKMKEDAEISEITKRN